MASNLESSMSRGSDLIVDFSCLTCQDNDRSTKAEFYCEECSKYYCCKCVKNHDFLCKKHSISGISQFPVPYMGELELCQEHKEEKLSGFCEDHKQLICHACHDHNHQDCRTTQNKVNRENKPKESSLETDHEKETTPGFKVNKSNPESSLSRQYSHGNQTRDLMTSTSHLTKSRQASDPVSSSSQQPVEGYPTGAESKPDPIIKVKGSERYNVNIPGDKYKCAIYGICETTSGELIIIDWTNSKVKLLDQTYKVVSHCDLPYDPLSMCSISSNVVAVAVANSQFNHKVHFFGVKNGRLTKKRIINLENYCDCIAYHDGYLYASGERTLYQYTEDRRRRQVRKKLYQERYGEVSSCAVSPDGERIYVANASRNKLITLSRDGKEISELTHPELVNCRGKLTSLHVTDSGQVLVCATGSVLQVFIDGRPRVAEVVTMNDGVLYPSSVHYSKHTGSLIVGMFGNNDILVFETQ